MEQRELPTNWTIATIEDIAAYVQRGKSPKYADRSELPVINQKCIRWHGIEKGFVKFVHDSQIAKWDEIRYLKKGDLLWNSTGTGTIGRACLYKDEFPQAVVDSHVTIVRADQRAIEPRYLRLFVMSPLVQEHFEEMQSGSTNQVELSRVAILEKELPLAPINEQRRIAEKVETLFAQLDKGDEALREVQKLLARYRQSVLKAAVTGDLAADWRAENAHRLEHGRDLLARILKARRETWQGRGKYKEPSAPDTSGLPDLPEGWAWASIAQLAKVIGGLTKNKKRADMPIRRPMLRVANVYQNRLEIDDIHETGVSEAEVERVQLENFDLLVVEGNGSKDQIGRMAIWRNEIPDAVHQNHLIKVRMLEKGLVEFALNWFQSAYGRQNIERVASSTSGLYTLSISKIGALVTPVPGLAEVAEINDQVADAFEKVTHLQEWAETELARSAALRQSILKEAFAGRLVPQDPADEPAAELLARIKETGAVSPKKSCPKAPAKVAS